MKRWKKSYKEGKETEVLFRKLAEVRGYEVFPSPPHININNHIDYYLYKNGKTISVDIKSGKKINRSNLYAQEEWVWIELKNVKGQRGWLYGDAIYIAFEIEEGFFIVKRKQLENLVENLIENTYVSKAEDAKYKKYTRVGREDILTLMTLKDFKENLTNEIWIKEKPLIPKD